MTLQEEVLRGREGLSWLQDSQRAKGTGTFRKTARNGEGVGMFSKTAGTLPVTTGALQGQVHLSGSRCPCVSTPRLLQCTGGLNWWAESAPGPPAGSPPNLTSGCRH